MSMRRNAAIGLFAFVLVGCAGQPTAPRRADAEFRPIRGILEAYDADHDGTVTRAEMERGLRADFAKADVNHTGCLDADEVRAVNEQRWEQDQSTASPLVDFRGRGCIDFDTFAATARSLFDQMDMDSDGKVSPQELRPRRSAPSRP